MLQLNEHQLKRLKKKLDHYNEKHQLEVDKVITEAKSPGMLANKLGWVTAELIFNDHMRVELTRLFGFAGDEESKTTLESLTAWYTDEIIRWRPKHSTNPVANLEEEMRHQVWQEVLELLNDLRLAGD